MDLGRGGGGVFKVKEEVTRTAAEQRLRLWTRPAPTAEEEQATSCVGHRTKLHIRAGSCAAGICPKQPQGQRAANTGAVPRSPSITEQRSGAEPRGRGGWEGSRGLWGAPGGSRAASGPAQR